MKKIFAISMFVLLLVLLLPLLFVPGFYFYRPIEENYPPEGPPKTEDATEIYPETDATIQAKVGADATLMLSVLHDSEIVYMSMEDYLIGVVAAEMPARFHTEALRAQAIAARTYSLYRMLLEPAARHPEAYVCISYACCKAFLDEERLRERWGAAYDYYIAQIRDAVNSTDGIILLFEEAPILAAFHSSSYGFTEASGSIWGALPYLQSVESFETVYDVPRFYDTLTFSFPQFREIVQNAVSGTVMTDDNIPYWISDVTYTPSGRLAHLNLGGVEVTGAQFRRMFSLRSAFVMFSFDENGVTVTTGGYGHGVGMSQFGANTMANAGATFSEILLWYYTDVTLGHFTFLFES